MKTYIVTHGKRFNGPDPSMTEEGYNDVAALRSKLPENPAQVVCGTGKRMRQVAEAVRLKPTRHTASVGSPDAGDFSDGIEKIVFADGTTIPYSMYTEEDGAPAFRAIVLALPDESVICTGRVSVIMLGLTLAESKSGAVYVVEHDGNEIQSLTLI